MSANNTISVDERFQAACSSLDFDPLWAHDVNDRELVIMLDDAAALHDSYAADGEMEKAAAAYAVVAEALSHIDHLSRELNDKGERKRTGWGVSLHKKGILSAFTVKVPSRAKTDEKWAAHQAKEAARLAKAPKAKAKKTPSLLEQLAALSPEQRQALVAALQAA